MSDDELKQLVASLAIAQKETEIQMQETNKRMEESDRRLKQKIEELGKQIGGLGEKFGSFTEGMAFPSMNKILLERFGMEAIAPRYKVRKNGQTMELDVFAYCNGTTQQAIIVEVKSHLRDEHITRMLKVLKEAKQFLPEHANKDFYGILAVVDAPEQLKEQVLKHGIYYAEIHDDVFEMKTPINFQARVF